MMKMKKTMRAMRAKLKSRAGESIAEVLVALLISSVAIVMLASMITTSARITNDSKKSYAEYYDANNALTVQDAGGTAATAVLRDGSNAVYLEGDSDVSVSCFVNDKAPSGTPIISYK